MITRPAIFKWRQTEPGLIVCAVRWYLRYSLSLRDVEELLEERGLHVDHTTVWRWVQDYGPELEQRLRQHLKPTNKSWRVDETYVRVKGRWCYLYRAIDSKGATIDFLLSTFRDADAAKRLFRKALGDRSHPQPRVINTDLAPIYSSAIPDSKKEGMGSFMASPPPSPEPFSHQSRAGLLRNVNQFFNLATSTFGSRYLIIAYWSGHLGLIVHHSPPCPKMPVMSKCLPATSCNRKPRLVTFSQAS